MQAVPGGGNRLTALPPQHVRCPAGRYPRAAAH
ncbi:hypothetical protein [Pseudarthrobacter sp. BIM B-2242]